MLLEDGGENIAQLVGDLRQQRTGKPALRHGAEIALIVNLVPDRRAPAEALQFFQRLWCQKIVHHHHLGPVVPPLCRDVGGIGGIDRPARQTCAVFQVKDSIDLAGRKIVALLGIVLFLVRQIGAVAAACAGAAGAIIQFRMAGIERHALAHAPAFRQESSQTGKRFAKIRRQRQGLVETGLRFAAVFQVAQHHAAAAPARGVIRFNGKALVTGGQRFIEAFGVP